MTTVHAWYRNNSHWFRLTNLRDRDDVLVGASATVSMIIYKAGTTQQADITGVTWPVALDYVSDGTFEVILDNTDADIEPTELADALITVDAGGVLGEFALLLKMAVRYKPN